MGLETYSLPIQNLSCNQSRANPRLILLASEFPPGPGGIGAHAFQLAKGLSGRGWSVHVVSPQDYSDCREIDQFNHDIRFHVHRVLPEPNTLRDAINRIKCLQRAAKGGERTVILSSGSKCVILGSLFATMKRLPSVAIAHGSEFGPTGQRAPRSIRWGFGMATSTVSVSEFTKDRMLRSGVRPRCSLVIPNGADTKTYKRLQEPELSEARREIIAQGSPSIITVGNVTERKGQEVVIRSLPQVVRAFPGLAYYVVGLSTDQSRLESIANELQVCKHVRFMGRTDTGQLVRLLNASDLFVMTSRTTPTGDCEGFGIAVVEAALCGLPSIVSDGSGLREAILEGKTGLIVPQNDPDATARAILDLLRDGEKRRSMSDAALSYASQFQSWDRRIDDYESHLLSLIRAPDDNTKSSPKSQILK